MDGGLKHRALYSLIASSIFHFLHCNFKISTSILKKKKSVTEDFNFSNYLADKRLRMAPAITCLPSHLAIFCDNPQIQWSPILKTWKPLSLTPHVFQTNLLDDFSKENHS